MSELTSQSAAAAAAAAAGGQGSSAVRRAQSLPRIEEGRGQRLLQAVRNQQRWLVNWILAKYVRACGGGALWCVEGLVFSGGCGGVRVYDMDDSQPPASRPPNSPPQERQGAAAARQQRPRPQCPALLLLLGPTSTAPALLPPAQG